MILIQLGSQNSRDWAELWARPDADYFYANVSVKWEAAPVETRNSSEAMKRKEIVFFMLPSLCF